MLKMRLYILLFAVVGAVFLTNINFEVSDADSQLTPVLVSNVVKNQQPLSNQKVSESAWDKFKKDKYLQSKLIIVVSKSKHTLSLTANNIVLKTYHIELGDGGIGDKQILGDRKTPEGTFYIAEKSVLNPPSAALGTRWMRLSYPNIEDAQRGLNSGLISHSTYSKIVSANNNHQTPPQRTALGGGVGIHGGSVPEYGNDWTAGCVGLTNKNIEEFYNYVRIGTPVIIKK